MSVETGAAASIHAHELTRILAAFRVETPAAAIPPAALESGRQLVLDTIGVSLLASTHRVGTLISTHSAELGGHHPRASVFGRSGLRVTPLFAAQANGVMANALDYDGGAHLPTRILPAVLAVAEELGASGRDALAAFVIGCEASFEAFEPLEPSGKIVDVN